MVGLRSLALPLGAWKAIETPVASQWKSRQSEKLEPRAERQVVEWSICQLVELWETENRGMGEPEKRGHGDRGTGGMRNAQGVPECGVRNRKRNWCPQGDSRAFATSNFAGLYGFPPGQRNGIPGGAAPLRAEVRQVVNHHHNYIYRQGFQSRRMILDVAIAPACLIGLLLRRPKHLLVGVPPHSFRDLLAKERVGLLLAAWTAPLIGMNYFPWASD